ncbi:hypothetical protein LMG28688_03591 [Paraburkholderia caffeinitolerans]|uniref:SnoaL-like domain-containing protein n=1 Tax=Paraburkholderia caffeinitolerans TaxID=1723730 RepID=A0A6J5G6U7_9BURK|nr:hypothetical protein LMG28688_03591 [Paraburkholderia caffeinitolerans]
MADPNARHALYDLACRYAQAVDRRDWAQLTEMFVPDAQLSGPAFMFGDRDAIVAGLRGIERYDTTQHHIHNQLLAFEGNDATAETYCIAQHVYTVDGVKRKLDWGMRYHDRCVFDGSAWRFASRSLLVDWTQDLPLEG